MPRSLPFFAIATSCLAVLLPARAAVLTVSVSDADGRPLPEAVVLLEPASGRVAVKPEPDTEIEQRQRQFQPTVKLITVGTRVSFPNFDTVRHHVYSFSAIKPFELKLYAGVPATPVLFDKPGIARLGCNIHDRMAAWVVVAATPWKALSDAAGLARLDTPVPAGSYQLIVWHPALGAETLPAPQALTVGAADTAHAVRLAVKP